MQTIAYRYLVYFTLTLGSFLLFQVQPIMARMIQPWLGSASSVWTACMMFFQCFLLLGYLYAHALHRLRVRMQALLHGPLIVLALALLWFHASHWPAPIKPSVLLFESLSFGPVGIVVALLGISVGLPFLILAANSTLMQAWFHRAFPERNAYSLYALSNAGSLLSLLSYPFVIENTLTLSQQSWMWTGGFLLYALCMLATSFLASRIHEEAHEPCAVQESDGALADGTPKGTRAACRPAGGKGSASGSDALPWHRLFSWIGLSFLGSAYLLAVTNELTQDITPTPFLWLAPLSLYLLTFIIAFSSRMDAWRGWLLLGGLVGASVAVYALHQVLTLTIYSAVGLLLFSLFAVCLFCHSLLYTLRPEAGKLTLFYVMISLGGFLGGVFLSLVAPLIFPAYWDIQLLVFLTLVAACVQSFASRTGPLHTYRYLIAAVALSLCFPLAQGIQKECRDSIFLTRNFYGTMRVEHEARGEGEQVIHRYQLMHGHIVHGIQFSRTRFRNRPTAYFHEETGLGRAIQRHPLRNVPERPFRIGVVGEGIGTIAAYGRPGDFIRFYELNPEVHKLAAESPWFTYLRDAQGTVDVVIGDGRLSLERERNDPESPLFDVLVLDAFSSDAIPVHLLTREAIETCLQRLEPEHGVLAFHATNKHLNFLPLGKAIAEHFGLTMRAIWTKGDGRITLPCLWLLFCRDPEFFEQPAFQAGAVGLGAVKPVRLWTDDYSSLFDLMLAR